MTTLPGSDVDWDEIDQGEYVQIWRSWYSENWGRDPGIERVNHGSTHLMLPLAREKVLGLAYVGLWGEPDAHYYREAVPES